MKKRDGYMDYDTQLKDLSRNLRQDATTSEKIMWEAIRKRAIEGCRFLRQKPIRRYIADFYCAELLLVIEIDGSSHDEKQEMDTNRTDEMEACGITVIRYTNDQVMYHLPDVIDHLSYTIRNLRKNI